MKRKNIKLSEVSRYLLVFISVSVANLFLLYLQQKCINKWKEQANKNRSLFLLMDQWVKIKQEGKRLENFFGRNNFKKIAIYGMSNVGKRLIKELKDSEIKIAYGIDKNAENICSEIKLVTINEELENVDAVVITLVNDFEDVREILLKKLRCPIIVIEDIVNEV